MTRLKSLISISIKEPNMQDTVLEMEGLVSGEGPELVHNLFTERSYCGVAFRRGFHMFILLALLLGMVLSGAATLHGYSVEFDDFSGMNTTLLVIYHIAFFSFMIMAISLACTYPMWRTVGTEGVVPLELQRMWVAEERMSNLPWNRRMQMLKQCNKLADKANNAFSSMKTKMKEASAPSC